MQSKADEVFFRTAKLRPHGELFKKFSQLQAGTFLTMYTTDCTLQPSAAFGPLHRLTLKTEMSFGSLRE